MRSAASNEVDVQGNNLFIFVGVIPSRLTEP